MSERGSKAIEIANDLHNLVARLDHQLASERKTNAEQAAEIGAKEEQLIESAEQLQKMIKWYGEAVEARETARTQNKICHEELQRVQMQLRQAEIDNRKLWKRMNHLKHDFARIKSLWCSDNLALRTEQQANAILLRRLAPKQKR